ncbi:MAG TPA: oxidoreductase [Planctomycetaceae bacterium]|nr:oxidoreductase [Planctomycetaceae bacterium]
MTRLNTENPEVTVRRYNSVIVGAGAAGMNCAVHLYEFMRAKGIDDPARRIAVVTRGLPLGASRMSGSDKQTYYKLGTSPDTADSAADFAKSLTAAGCAHEDLALIEGIGSLREFYHLVRAGVPFPCDNHGSFVGYKTDHDPYQRATSAGPRTSRMMSQCLEREVEAYGIPIFDRQEVASLVVDGEGPERRIVAVVCVDAAALAQGRLHINMFECANLILAAGGPGALYETSVYPKGQVGLHGLAMAAGLAAENLTESQFGMASTKFRWNVSGTYMQAVPRIFSTDRDGNDPREFLNDAFPSMSRLATSTFLKGYQWPFDPQRIAGHQSSLIDVLVSRETQRGRRVFLDFRANPTGNETIGRFDLEALEAEALDYLQANQALQTTPIERLAHMNPLAIDIYAEHGIDLYNEPLEIAVCAQHCNGGLAVNHWWESSVPHTFVIGEMAGTHGVKRPGGSALNAGQVGGLRAAEYLVNVYGAEVPSGEVAAPAIEGAVARLCEKWTRWQGTAAARGADEVIGEIQARMTAAGAHLRRLDTANRALADAVTLVDRLRSEGPRVEKPQDLTVAIQAEHLASASAAFLAAIVAFLEQGGGSRGSFLVLDDDGETIDLDPCGGAGEGPLRFRSENQALRESILRVVADDQLPSGFRCEPIAVRKLARELKAFEVAWREFRDGAIFG